MNARSVTSSYLDYVALAGGVGALLLGALAAVPVLRANPRNNTAVAVVGTAAILGVVQLLRALGKLG